MTSDTVSFGYTEVARDEKDARAIAQRREQRQLEERLGARNTVTLEELYRTLRVGAVKELNIVIKGDVQGSVQAVRDSLQDLGNAEVRARILSRRALSDEGDYFALLGVSRNATSYDIRRAYLSLKEEFDPSRILSGETVDLRDAVELILEVLAEAHEILEDDLRRDRYRRALDASP